MELSTILVLACALAMDATAVAFGVGASLTAWEPRSMLRLSLHFGIFQFLMPLVGWLAGLSVSLVLQRYDHWIAFALLMSVASHMLYESFHSDLKVRGDPTRGVKLITLSLATSIDALAIGLTLVFLGGGILFPSVVIGIVAFGFSMCSGWLGFRTKKAFGRAARILGVAVLATVAVRIVASHLSAGI